MPSLILHYGFPGAQKALRTLVLLPLLIGLSGCIVESENPITPPNPEFADRALTGHWKSVQENGKDWDDVTIQSYADGTLSVKLQIDDDEAIEFAGHFSILSGQRHRDLITQGVDIEPPQRFVNLRLKEGVSQGPDNGKESEPGYLFVLYSLDPDGNTLRAWLLDREEVHKSYLSTEYESPDRTEWSNLWIRSPSEEIATFLADAPFTVFGNAMRFQRK